MAQGQGQQDQGLDFQGQDQGRFSCNLPLKFD